MTGSEFVERGRDRALHRVLDRHDRAHRLALAYSVERRLHGRIRYGLGLRGLIQAAQSGLGECTFRAEVSVPVWHVAHNLTVVLTHYAALRTAPLISHH